LTHTPWWVFVIFFYLLKVGIDAIKPRIVSLKKLFITPSIFLGISINTLLKSFDFSFPILGVYIVALLLGMIIGFLLTKNSKIKFDHYQKLVKLPGTFSTLFLTLIIFSSKYYLGYSLATNPTIASKTFFIISQLGIMGICSGLFIGRSTGLLYEKSNASHEALERD